MQKEKHFLTFENQTWYNKIQLQGLLHVILYKFDELLREEFCHFI